MIDTCIMCPSVGQSTNKLIQSISLTLSVKFFVRYCVYDAITYFTTCLNAENQKVTINAWDWNCIFTFLDDWWFVKFLCRLPANASLLMFVSPPCRTGILTLVIWAALGPFGEVLQRTIWIWTSLMEVQAPLSVTRSSVVDLAWTTSSRRSWKSQSS